MAMEEALGAGEACGSLGIQSMEEELANLDVSAGTSKVFTDMTGGRNEMRPVLCLPAPWLTS